MATIRHSSVVAILLMISFHWMNIVQSTPSPTAGTTDNRNIENKDNTQQQAPVAAAQYKLPEIRWQNNILYDGVAPLPKQFQPKAQLFYQRPQQPAAAASGDVTSVVALEMKDGVDVPPQIQKYIVDFFDKQSDESTMLNDVNHASGGGGRVKRSTYDQYGGGYGGSYGGYGSGSGYGQSYGGDSYGHEGSSYGSYGSYGTGHSYGKGLYVPNKLSYGHGYTKSPLISFVKGFKPGKTYVDKGHVIRNYYRHGSYNVALQHYKLIPTVKVVPFTTYKKIGVGQKVEAKYRYKAHICKYCYHGHPKIDVYEMKKPYSYAVRRFVYLPKSYDLNSYGHGGDSYEHGGSGYGGDSYGHGGDSYGYGGDSYGHGGDGYGHGGDSYGYGGNNYGHGGDSYGYGADSYGQYGNSYGYGYGHGGDSYGYGGNNDGYGGNSYGYGGNSYGYGGNGYGYGGNSYGYGGNSYGYGGSGGSNGYGGGYGNDYKKAKVTYHNYYEGNGSYGGQDYHKK